MGEAAAEFQAEEGDAAGEEGERGGFGCGRGGGGAVDGEGVGAGAGGLLEDRCAV